MQQPKTQKEMLQQLWFVVIGSNGDGLAEQVKEIRKDIAALKSRGGIMASRTLRWIATTVGVILLGGLITLATYGIIHALEQVPTLGH